MRAKTVTKVFSLLAMILSILSVVMFFLSYALFPRLERFYFSSQILPNPTINIMKLACLLITMIILVIVCILSLSLDRRKLLVPMIIFFAVMIILSILYYYSDTVWTYAVRQQSTEILASIAVINQIQSNMVNPFLNLAKICFYVMVGTSFAADRK